MLDYSTLTPLVKRVAQAAHVNFPPHYDSGDTEQTLWLWVLENKNTINEILNNPERSEGTLYNLMLKAANSHLKKEDQAAYGYSEEDVFSYPLEAVKTALEAVFDYEDWQSFSTFGDGQPKSKGQANQTGDHVVMMIDVKRAVEGLPTDQYNAIVWTYKMGYTAENLAFELDITEDAAKKRVQRAVKAVHRALGKKPYADLRRGYDGRREPEGNAESLALTERQYEG